MKIIIQCTPKAEEKARKIVHFTLLTIVAAIVGFVVLFGVVNYPYEILKFVVTYGGVVLFVAMLVWVYGGFDLCSNKE